MLLGRGVERSTRDSSEHQRNLRDGRFNVTAIEGLFNRNRVGLPQRFCDHACRQAAYRRRRGASEDAPSSGREVEVAASTHGSVQSHPTKSPNAKHPRKERQYEATVPVIVDRVRQAQVVRRAGARVGGTLQVEVLRVSAWSWLP